MRGITLTDLVARLRAEIGHSTNVTLGANTEDYLTQVIRRTQDKLWEEYDWSHLRISRDIAMVANTRYYAVPAILPYERIIGAQFKWGDRWQPLAHGVGEIDYSIWDSDRGITSWPVLKWDVAEDTQDTAGLIDDRGMIEVWPIPSRGAGAFGDGMVRITGFRKIKPLLVGNDKCEIDGTLIVLFAAAEIIARQNQSDAQMKIQLAQQLLSRLMNQSSNKKKYFSFYDDYEDCTGGFRPREVTSVSNLGGGIPVDTGPFLPLAGGSMAGDIIFTVDPAASLPGASWGLQFPGFRVYAGNPLGTQLLAFDGFTSSAYLGTGFVWHTRDSDGTTHWTTQYANGILSLSDTLLFHAKGAPLGQSDWRIKAGEYLGTAVLEVDGFTNALVPTSFALTTRRMDAAKAGLSFFDGRLLLDDELAFVAHGSPPGQIDWTVKVLEYLGTYGLTIDGFTTGADPTVFAVATRNVANVRHGFHFADGNFVASDTFSLVASPSAANAQCQVGHFDDVTLTLGDAAFPTEVINAPEFFVLKVGDSSSAITSGADKESMRLPCGFKLGRVRASLRAAQTGADLVIDVKLNGVSIFGAFKVAINPGEDTSATADFPPDYVTTDFPAGGKVSVDVVSTGTGGAGLEVAFIGRYTGTIW